MPKAKQPVSFFGHEFIAPGIRCRFRQTVCPVTVRRITGDPLRRAFATRHGNVFQAEIVQIVIRIKQPELFTKEKKQDPSTDIEAQLEVARERLRRFNEMEMEEKE